MIQPSFRDDKEAVKWYRLAADQGEAAAQHNLGLMYANARGVPQNFSEAYVWYSLSAANNGPEEATTFRDLPDLRVHGQHARSRAQYTRKQGVADLSHYSFILNNFRLQTLLIPSTEAFFMPVFFWGLDLRQVLLVGLQSLTKTVSWTKELPKGNGD